MKRNQTKFYLLFLLLFTTIISARWPETQIADAEKMLNAGYITKAEFETFKTEASVEILKVPYGDHPIKSAYALCVYGLYNDSGKGYRLADPVTKSEAVVLAMKFLGFEKEVESSSYQNPFTNIPEDAVKYVAFAANKKYLPDAWAKGFAANERVLQNEYLTIVFKALGYVEGSDFTAENIKQFRRDFNIYFDPSDKDFMRSHAMSISASALGSSFKNSLELLRDRLIKKGLINKSAYDLLDEQSFTEAYSTIRDNLAKVYWKYSHKYDFITILDCRNGPAPIHPGMQWPDKGVSLEYAGYLRIKNKNVDDNQLSAIIKDILTDLGLNDNQLTRTMGKYKSGGEAQHIDYYDRIINIKKKGNVTELEFYLAIK